jgi:hypothetical protein
MSSCYCIFLIGAQLIAISVEQTSMQTYESFELILQPVPYHSVLCSSHKFLLIITLRHELRLKVKALVKRDWCEGEEEVLFSHDVPCVCGLCVGVRCIALSVQCGFLNTATCIVKGSKDRT